MDLTVADLVQRFDTGEIRLPLMQRDYVWKPNKVVRLLDSLYRGWPIGSFYVWQTQDGHPTKARVGNLRSRRLDGFYGFLLDGQQRLTSLSLAIQGDARSWPSGRLLKDVLKDGLAADPLAVHHIFPKKYMQDRDFPVDRLNTVANYAILSQADNSELGDQDPLDAWRSLKSNQREYASVQLCFVANDTYLRPDAYEEFLAFRAEKLAEQLNKFIGLGKQRGKAVRGSG
jgi:hypothetical protein